MGVVEHVLGTCHEPFGVVTGGEESAVHPVREEVEEEVGRADRLIGPAGLPGRLSEAGEGVDHGGVVCCVSEVPCTGLGLPGAEPAAVFATEVGEEEVGVLPGSYQPVLPAGGGGSLSECGEHQAVPLGQDLVVESGADPQFPDIEEGLPGTLHPGRAQQVAPNWTVQDVGALEVSLRADAVPGDRLVCVGAGGCPYLQLGPDVEATFDSLRVGILGSSEPTARESKVPEHVPDGLLGDL